MAKEEKCAPSGQKEILAAYKPSEGREKMTSNVGEYQTSQDPKSMNR